MWPIENLKSFVCFAFYFFWTALFCILKDWGHRKSDRVFNFFKSLFKSPQLHPQSMKFYQFVLPFFWNLASTSKISISCTLKIAVFNSHKLHIDIIIIFFFSRGEKCFLERTIHCKSYYLWNVYYVPDLIFIIYKNTECANFTYERGVNRSGCSSKIVQP